MITTTSTLGLASSLPSVDQRRGHIGRSQEPQSAFVCWPPSGGKYEVSTSCVSSSGPRGRLRGCHLNPCPSISAATEASRKMAPSDWTSLPPAPSPSWATNPTAGFPATNWLQGWIGLSENETNSTTSSATSLFHLLLLCTDVKAKIAAKLFYF